MKSGKCLGHRALAPEGIGGFFLAPISFQDELLKKKKAANPTPALSGSFLPYTTYAFLSHIRPPQRLLPC